MKKLSVLLLFVFIGTNFVVTPGYSEQKIWSNDMVEQIHGQQLPSYKKLLSNLADSTGISGFIKGNTESWIEGFGRVVMIIIGLLLLYLGIAKKFEPLLLVTIAFGCILSNIPLAGISEPGGIIHYIYEIGIKTGAFPLIIFTALAAALPAVRTVFRQSPAMLLRER